VPDPGFAAAMQALQALHQKLDVADPAFASFTSRVCSMPGLAWRILAFSALALFTRACFSWMRARVSETASTVRKSVVVR